MANKLRFGMPMTDLYVTFKTPEECSYFYDEWLEHNTSLRNAEQWVIEEIWCNNNCFCKDRLMTQ